MITLRSYQDKKLGVFGLAKAGSATIASLLGGGAHLWAWDDKEETRAAIERQYGQGKLRLVKLQDWPWAELSALVLSPGVPLTHPEPNPAVALAHNHKVRIIGDVELLCEAQPHAKKIAITGTNGKSTTTSLVGHILQSAGKKAEVGGNLGTAALSLAPLGSDGCYVLELSSYQLDLLELAHFNVSLLLNVTPDHLDRHGDMQGYVAAKSHIFDRQTKNDMAIVSIDDDYARSVYAGLKQTAKSRLTGISVMQELKSGVFVDKDGMLHDKLDPGQHTVINLTGIISLTGRHNWQNAAFAYAACRLCGLAPREIEKGLRSFPGLRHRLQLAATIHGVRFINDSKATNADAASNALAPYAHIYWIAGGKPKEGGIRPLERFFPSIVHAFLIGEAQDEFAATLEGKVPFTRCKTLANAFAAAAREAFAGHKEGAVVLLSPACASFDQWKNFEERGDAFCRMADSLLSKVVSAKR